ncbi:uncharacterized protein HKW66_Vig0201450 [Vigna angularis]|uniref:Uncharacterized protein n=1 Tax=Phaseolus angularis TaxID=3914 RepID=A0A8T0JSN2_PHAAN|nr:uncharacterized protein HKW66_Vig0201450 [Vigna angularis]
MEVRRVDSLSWNGEEDVSESSLEEQKPCAGMVCKRTRLRGPHPIFSRPRNYCSAICAMLTGRILNRLGEAHGFRELAIKKEQQADMKLSIEDGSVQEQHLRPPVRSKGGRSFHSSTSCRDCGRSSSSLRVAPKKKGKRKAARETSAESKHAKRSLPDGPPLPSLLNPNSWVAKRLHFDLFAEEKALVSGMTEEEASNMALELTARSTMCQTYAAQKKTSISAELQALQAKFDSTFKANQDLTLRLAETERMAEEDKKKASTLLAEVRATQRRMQRSLDDAKLDLQKATSSHTTLTTEWDSLLDRVTKLEAEVKLLGDEVVNEHVLRFDKALAQCNLLFQVLTDDPRLDVSMMVVDSKLVPINIPPSSPSVGQNVDPAVEVVGETGEAAGQS